MLDALDKDLLKAVADLEDIPKGAYNIRKNGKLLSRATSANIDIESNKEGTGIIVTIAPGTVNESVHIPVILAGGLSPENVADAIRAVGPWGVDSLTHTNHFLPGGGFRKDPQRIQAFVTAARGAAPL